MTKRFYRRPPGGRKVEDDDRQLPRISMRAGLEPPVVPAGYNCIRADAETDALMTLRSGLQAQLAQLEDYIVERLEAKLAAQQRRP